MHEREWISTDPTMATSFMSDECTGEHDSSLKCKAFWFVLSQTVLSLTKLIIFEC